MYVTRNVLASRWQIVVRCLILMAAGLLVLSQSVEAQMTTGSYIGDGTDDRAISQLGFVPDVVIVKIDDAKEAVIRTSTMSGDNAKIMTGNNALTANLIQSFDADGFTVGSDDRVNKSTKVVYWMAFKAIDGELAVGTYTGDGTDNRTIDISDTSASSDFQPDYVIVMAATAREAYLRSSSMSGDKSFRFANNDAETNRIQAFATNGFEVGNEADVNGSGDTYHYVAWKSVANKMAVGSYTGDGIDDTNITGVGFDPEYVVIKAESKERAVHHPGSLGFSTDSTLYFHNFANLTDSIQDLRPGTCSNCFQVGSDKTVNENGRTIYWIAFARQAPPTAVTMRVFTAAAYQDGVLLRWKTGWEVNNLGFHVYREADGQRTRVTSSMIGGSALFVGPNVSLTAGRSYSWFDPAGIGSDRYWLEDIDLDGTRTMHGPMTPTVADTPRPTQAQSVLLRQLGRTQPSTQQAVSKRPTRPRRPWHVSDRHLVSAPRAKQPWEGRRLPPQTVQQALAATPAIKLAIRETGWYRVTQPDLVAAGLDSDTDPRVLQLFADGRQQRLVVEGRDDGRFDPDDAIAFYGQGLDTPWTDTRTYWLVAGSRSGKRVRVVPSRGAAAAPSSFPFTVEHKDRTIYFAALKNGETENFFGALVTTNPVAQALSLHHLDAVPPEDASLEVALQGVTTGPHQATIQLNGREVGIMTFAGQAHEVASFSIPHAWLQAGENLVTLVPQGGETDVSLVDHLRLTYWHTYTADEDTLRFTVPGRRQVSIAGFSSPVIRVMDVTYPQAIREIEAVVAPQEAGYAVTVAAPGWGHRTLLAFTEDRSMQPAAITPNAPSTWHQEEPGAELVILAHGALVDSVAPLKALREARGWSVALIEIEDLYDEFNFGHKSPWALRDFLDRASTQWSTPPGFVLLVGDASFDPRNYLGFGEVDLVPTKLVETAFLETASDDWLADFDDDGVPELAVGRLPVRTVEEAGTVVAKLVGYAQAGNAGTWTREALVVADANDGFDFEAASTAVSTLLPPELTVEELFPGQTDMAQARSELITRLNDGLLLVNYVGHGSVEVWTGSGLLTSTDARSLTNGVRLPVVVAMTCLNGFFHDLYTDSLAEALLTAEQGGAVAVWASSGLTGPAGQAVMNQALVGWLFGEEALTLGEAAVAAKAAVTDRDVRRTWNLFGDPTLRLK